MPVVSLREADGLGPHLPRLAKACANWLNTDGVLVFKHSRIRSLQYNRPPKGIEVRGPVVEAILDGTDKAFYMKKP